MQVQKWDEFVAACKAGGTVDLTADIDIAHITNGGASLISIAKDVVINGNGYAIKNYPGYVNATFFSATSNITINNLQILNCSNLSILQVVQNTYNTQVTLNDLTISVHYTTTIDYLIYININNTSSTLSQNNINIHNVKCTIFGNAPKNIIHSVNNWYVTISNIHIHLDCIFLPSTNYTSLCTHHVYNMSVTGILRNTDARLRDYKLISAKGATYALIDLDLVNTAMSLVNYSGNNNMIYMLSDYKYSLIYVRNNTTLTSIANSESNVVYYPHDASISGGGYIARSVAELQDINTYRSLSWVFAND